jgi:hypothetical protein
MILSSASALIVQFMLGFDILDNHIILVPAPLALWRYSVPKERLVETSMTIVVDPFVHQHTNGLASGNIFPPSLMKSGEFW